MRPFYKNLKVGDEVLIKQNNIHATVERLLPIWYSPEYFSFVNASNDIEGLKYKVESFDVKLMAFSPFSLNGYHLKECCENESDDTNISNIVANCLFVIYKILLLKS